MTPPAVTAARFDLDFSDRVLLSDPFPVYEQIRATGRVVWNGAVNAWAVTGYDDCFEVLADKGETFITVGSRHPEVTFWFEAANMIIADGPDHRRLRGRLARYFTPSAIERTWEPRVRELAADVLAPLLGRGGGVDLIADFTRIAVVIVAEMLGVPEEHYEDLRQWSRAVVGNLSFGHESAEKRAVMEDAITELNQYLAEEIKRHRRYAPEDLLTVMVNMPDWSEDEIRSSAVNLVLAGYNTMAKLMAECLVALEQHPAQRRLVAENPALIPNAVEEVVRWHGPSQAVLRLAARRTTVAHTQLKEGDVLYLLLGAANRDPARWVDPSSFDVGRPFQPNLGFSVGPHNCIATQLARLETRVALETLLARAPGYQLRDVHYGDAFFARGPEQGTIVSGGDDPGPRGERLETGASAACR